MSMRSRPAAPESPAWAAARARWPALDIDERRFREHLESLAPPAEKDADGGTLYVEDLYLALACALGQPRALELFESELLGPASSSLHRIDPSPAFSDEVKQLARQRLLLGEGGQPPRIATYAGRGPLLGWVRAAVVRIGLNRKRDQQRDRCTSAVPLVEGDLPAYDPEVLALRESHRSAFQRALRDALSRLPRRDRSVLRMHLVEGLNIDRIGLVYRVHRTTVARWLAAARAALREEVRVKLAQELGVPVDEVEQNIGSLPSHLELSLSRLLRTGPGP
jgi:RNA polymerase sigma-70 factor (ECF subfamily)